jgi:hypothetical protein
LHHALARRKTLRARRQCRALFASSALSAPSGGATGFYYRIFSGLPKRTKKPFQILELIGIVIRVVGTHLFNSAID